jgi:hypothetical protein
MTGRSAIMITLLIGLVGVSLAAAGRWSAVWTAGIIFDPND